MKRPQGIVTLGLLLSICAGGFSARPTDRKVPMIGGSGEEAEGLLDKSLAGAMQDVDEKVYAVRGVGPGTHWYDNMGRCFGGQYNRSRHFGRDPYKDVTGMTGGTSGWLYGRGPSSLSAVDVRTGKVRHLLQDPQGGVRDPCVSFDGKLNWKTKNLPTVKTEAILNVRENPYLVDPENARMSVILRAPPAKSAGGLGSCKNDAGQSPWPTKDHPDYRKMRDALAEYPAKYKAHPPAPPLARLDGRYLKERRRLGAYRDEKNPDPFVLDERYYQSLYEQYYIHAPKTQEVSP